MICKRLKKQIQKEQKMTELFFNSLDISRYSSRLYPVSCVQPHIKLVDVDIADFFFDLTRPFDCLKYKLCNIGLRDIFL